MPDGSVVPIPAENIDETKGNLSCVVEGGIACCVAADGSQQMSLKINDDDYVTLTSIPNTAGPDGPYETGEICDDNNYWHQPNDPFPMFAVGGDANACNWGIGFSLTALCPEDVESSDFGLKYQFADRYIVDLSGQPASSGNCAGNVRTCLLYTSPSPRDS